MFRQVVYLDKQGGATLSFATKAAENAVIYVGLAPGTWDYMAKSRSGGIITIRFLGLKPGEAVVSLMVEGSGEPVRFPFTFVSG